jgi:ribose transport system permease protein
VTFVIVSGGIDLSGGSIAACAQIVTAEVFRAMGGTRGSVGADLAGLAVALACGGAWGAVNGFIITKMAIPPFIATLATLGAALGAADVIGSGQDLATVPSQLSNELGLQQVFGVPLLVAPTAVVVLIAAYALSRTRFGQHTYAVGSDATAASRVGIDVQRHRFRIYLLAGVTYGIVAYLDMARYSTSTIGGYSDTSLYAIAAVAIGGASLYGGTGTILGTIIGVLIPAVLQNGLVIAGAPSFYEQIGVGIALVLAVYADQLRRRFFRLSLSSPRVFTDPSRPAGKP